MKSKEEFVDSVVKLMEAGYTTQDAVGSGLGVSARSIRTWCNDWGVDWKALRSHVVSGPEEEAPIFSGTTASPDTQRQLLEGRKYVFTAAQNNTLIHEGFFEALQLYCTHNDAELIVGRFAYNTAGWKKTKGDDELWYDARIMPYVLDRSAIIEGVPVVWCGELDINPTAANPLSSLHSYTQDKSGIVPHAKVQLQSMPVFKGDDPKMMYTTGAITQRNYIERKTGQIAAFHHVIGALVVEVDEDGDWFARQLIADESGTFYDLDYEYTEYGVEHCPVTALNYGDVHAEKTDEVVAAASWEEGGMLDVLEPSFQFVHDLSDFMARNHHNRDNPFFLAEMLRNKTDVVEHGLIQAATILHTMERDWCTTVVVHSNHDAALKLWMQTADISKDPANARFWHEMNADMYAAIERDDKDYDPFASYMVNQACVYANFLAPDESFRLHGIEFGMHGHMGISGARGSNASFKRLNTKANVGHTHSPAIVDGVYCAGVSGSMEMDYNKGPSTWAQAHIVTYANGKRAIIQIKNGKWRAHATEANDTN